MGCSLITRPPVWRPRSPCAPDGSTSGWAGDEAADWTRIETERIASAAARKCQDWRGKTGLDAGRYDVVLEPTAVGMLMLRMRNTFDARSADEGRSFFSNQDGGTRIGERLFDTRVTLVSDPGAPDAETAPFANDGVARAPETWVEDGVLESLAYSRFWAERRETDPRPAPANLLMSGGSDSVEEMISSTERGVLITRFWYIRGLDPRRIAYTGLTRDGTFLIEDGKISRPVNNFRFNPFAGGSSQQHRDDGGARPSGRGREQLCRGADRRARPQSARVQSR